MDKPELEELLEEVNNTPELTLFFKRLFEDSNYWKLFFLHREEIFPVTDNNFLKYIFWNNVSEGPIRDFKILSNLAELKSISSQSTQNNIKSEMFSSELIKSFQDPLMYSLIQFVRANPKIIDLITNEQFDYKTMKKTLSDYSSINLQFLDEISNGFSGKEVNDSDLMKMILPVIVGLQGGLQNVTSKIGHYLPDISETLPAAFLTIHSQYSQHLTNLLKISGLSKLDYTDLLSDLHSQKNLTNLNTVFWCNNCIDESIVLNTESSLNPNHQNLSCPRCSNKLSASTVFELDEIIEEAIMDKDGLLELATAWLLAKNEIDSEINHSDEKYEYDFICKIPSNNVLIECKMHRLKHDERQLRLWIEEDLRQLQEHYSKIKESYEIKHPIVVSNIDVAKNIEIINEIKGKFPAELNYANIGALPEVIKRVKPN